MMVQSQFSILGIVHLSTSSLLPVVSCWDVSTLGKVPWLDMCLLSLGVSLLQSVLLLLNSVLRSEGQSQENMPCGWDEGGLAQLKRRG